MKTKPLDTQLLEDYLDGTLDARMMHFVEREALEDPFVSEALEGLSASRNRKQSISILQRQLQERIAEQPAKRRRWNITTHRLSIAATGAVLFVAGSLIYWMVESNKRAVSAEADKQVEVQISAASRSAAVSTAASGFTGRVISSDNVPVVAAQILDAEGRQLALTDSEGRFILRQDQLEAAAQESATLRILAPGFKDKVFRPLSKDGSELSLQLEASH